MVTLFSLTVLALEMIVLRPHYSIPPQAANPQFFEDIIP